MPGSLTAAVQAAETLEKSNLPELDHDRLLIG